MVINNDNKTKFDKNINISDNYGEPIMKSRWIKIVLAASLALNLAFLGTFIYKQINKPNRKHKFPKDTKSIVQKIKSDLNLNDRQSKDIWKIMRQFRVKIIESRKSILEKRMDIIESLGDPDYSPADIEEKVNALSEAEKEYNRVFIESLMKIGNILEPDQRLELLMKISRPWFFMKGPRNRPQGPQRSQRSRRPRRNYDPK